MNALVNVGDVLAGKYRVDRILGIGGMGMVVAATHLELDQKVALKFMLPGALASAQAADRFLREARAVVRLRSEHVCRVLDVGRLVDDAPYIVMELMEGMDFAQLLEAQGPLTVTDAVDHVLQALEGLAEAHANEIVHRDLKPGNLFVTADNDGSVLVKVLDFGISKSSIAGSATKTGEIMGSPSYMAPEQMMSSKDVDGRADVWAIGVILYEAVSGKLPFEHESLPALCMSVMHEEPPRLDAVSAVPPAFAAVVMRCLAKPREARFPEVGALAAALVPFASLEARSSAVRIAKVLRRANVVVAESTPWMATTRVPPESSTRPIGRQSTLGSTASESLGLTAPPTRSAGARVLRLLLLATAVAGAAGGIVVLAASRGQSSETPLAPSSQPRPSLIAPPIAPVEPAPPGVSAQRPPPPTTPAQAPSPGIRPMKSEVQPTPGRELANPTRKPTRKIPAPAVAPRPRREHSVAVPAAPATVVDTKPRPVDSKPSPPLEPGAATVKPSYKGTKGSIITDYPKD